LGVLVVGITLASPLFLTAPSATNGQSKVGPPITVGQRP